ncbi:hypothetical protein ACU4GI_39780 [Cupriavidus basilensis]
MGGEARTFAKDLSNRADELLKNGKLANAENLYSVPSPTVLGTHGANMLMAVCSMSDGGVGNAATSA